MTMLTPEWLKEIQELGEPWSISGKMPEYLRPALRELLEDRVRLLARVEELELFIRTGDEVAEGNDQESLLSGSQE